MSQFGIDITFQFDPDASTIPASSLAFSLPRFALSPSFLRQCHSLLLAPRDAN